MKQIRTLAAAAALIAMAAPAVAQAHPTAKFIQTKTSIRVSHRTVLGHPVRVCSWRPGDRHVRGLVRYSRTHLLTVPGWAQAGRKRSRAVCALNGGTYRTATPNQYRPSGTVYAQGRRIRKVMDAPAVGFLPGGRVIFGARAARRHGSGNVMNGLAMLVEHGHVLRSHADAPWTTRSQYACGAPGTDGVYGCSRSAVVAFRNGRVGLVEVMHASMPAAAVILRTMGAKAAITFDSGGAAGMWTLLGRHNLSRSQVGRYIGATMGTPWHRHIPDAIIVNARKL
jgi:hypothetical protein